MPKNSKVTMMNDPEEASEVEVVVYVVPPST